MYENFNFYKAEKFLIETKQVPYILEAVPASLKYDEFEVLQNLEHKKICNYYMIEKLYCLIIQEMDYYVQFTLDELIECIKHFPSRFYKKYNEHAFNYVSELYKKLKNKYKN